jgi:hypothetical protein
MPLNLHKNVRTTPAIRRELRESTVPTAELARRDHLSKATVRQWRQCEAGADRSHRPVCLQTTRSTAHDALVVVLRQTLLLPLDDLLAVPRLTHEGVSRSGLDRCLRCHGVSDLQALLPQEPTVNRLSSPAITLPRAVSMSTSSTCRRCPTRTNAATCSPLSIALRAGSLSRCCWNSRPHAPKAVFVAENIRMHINDSFLSKNKGFLWSVSRD